MHLGVVTLAMLAMYLCEAVALPGVIHTGGGICVPPRVPRERARCCVSGDWLQQRTAGPLGVRER